MFLIFTCSICGQLFYASTALFRDSFYQNQSLFELGKSWFYILYSGLIGLFALLLFILQLVMIGRGLTTLELLRNYWKGMINPYNRGCLRNYIDCFFSDRSTRVITLNHIKMLKSQDYEMSTTSSLDLSVSKSNLNDNLV